MKKEDGEIVCDRCGESLGKYESDCKIHYCTSHSWAPYCDHDYQIIDPEKRLEQCIHCKFIRSFPRYPYTLGEEIEHEKNLRSL